MKLLAIKNGVYLVLPRVLIAAALAGASLSPLRGQTSDGNNVPPTKDFYELKEIEVNQGNKYLPFDLNTSLPHKRTVRGTPESGPDESDIEWSADKGEPTFDPEYGASVELDFEKPFVKEDTADAKKVTVTAQYTGSAPVEDTPQTTDVDRIYLDFWIAETAESEDDILIVRHENAQPAADEKKVIHWSKVIVKHGAPGKLPLELKSSGTKKLYFYGEEQNPNELEEDPELKSELSKELETEKWFWIGTDEKGTGEAKFKAKGDLGTGLKDAPEEKTVNLLPVEVVVTDITGFRGIGETPATMVPRIPLATEPDGIACDWRDDVDDGAMLLLRFIAPSEFTFTAQFGHNDSGFIQGLPTGPARDGEFVEPSSADKAHLQGLGLKIRDEEYDSGRTVYDMRIYKPATEFDLESPQNPDKERDVKLAVKATGTGAIAGVEIEIERKLTLTRPPLVLVHGVNSDNGAWGTFAQKFENEWGFICRDFRVDHSGVDSSRPSEGKTYGFGQVTTTCLKVRDKITDATKEFRDGKYFDKKIAVQKVDVVAHSYGGLLTRWYTEMAGSPEGKEFADRRDVRKIITLGTPHKGSPLANMVCEVFANPLIANASSEGVGALELSMSNLLGQLDVPGIGTGLATGKLPNALSASRTAPRHAYQEFAVNSQRLQSLNANPLHSDIGYAAITGTKNSLFGLADFKSFVPNHDTFLPGDAKPYFPWIDLFTHDGVDLDGTDAIVPKWSSKISAIAADYLEVDNNHVELTNSDAVMTKTREWLNREISLGTEHRPSWVTVPVSERNAHKGSVVGSGGVSIGGGLRNDAIVKVELTTGSTASFTLSTDAATVGIKDATLTGMIKVSRIGTESFTLVADQFLDDVLNNVGVPTAAALNISAADMAGAGGSHYVPFTRKNVKYGRLHENKASGPDGESDAEDTVLIGYELQGEPGQSPPTELVLPDYVLDPPIKAGLTLELSGAIDVSGAGSGSQSVETRVYDRDSLSLDDLLDTKAFTLTHPAIAWDDVLIPYHTNVSLFVDGTGDVAGAQGSSHENPAQAFQYLVRPGFASNSESIAIDVP